LEYIKKQGIDVLSMIRVDEEEDEGRSFSSESLRTQDQQVTFRPKLKRHESYSPGTSRKKKHTSLHDFGVHDPLLLPDVGDTLIRTQSAHDLGKLSPDLVHNGTIKNASSMYDMEYGEREEVLSQVSVKI
jgi:hypothetical protein